MGAFKRDATSNTIKHTEQAHRPIPGEGAEGVWATLRPQSGQNWNVRANTEPQLHFREAAGAEGAEGAEEAEEAERAEGAEGAEGAEEAEGAEGAEEAEEAEGAEPSFVDGAI